jgi:hypothetical protein
MTYDAEWMRDNAATLQAEDWQAIHHHLACHRHHIDADDAADLASWVDAHRPELITRKDRTWHDSRNANPLSLGMTRISVHPPMTGHEGCSGSSPSRCSTSDARSSDGPSDYSPWRYTALWWVPEMIGGASLVWLAVVLFRNLRGV